MPYNGVMKSKRAKLLIPPEEEQIQLTLRLNHSLYGQLVKRAQEERRSLNGQICFILQGFFGESNSEK